jgi:hypothetical protein
MEWFAKIFPRRYGVDEKKVALIMCERIGRALMNGTVKGIFFTPMVVSWAPMLATTDWGSTSSFLISSLFSVGYASMFFTWFNNKPFGYEKFQPDDLDDFSEKDYEDCGDEDCGEEDDGK